ncbi:MAG: hypothetical protein ACREBG_21055 [Pyrinomonadaceae bacterium]
MKNPGIIYRLVTLVLQAALVLALLAAGWLVYRKLPTDVGTLKEDKKGEATIQIVMRPAPEMAGVALDIPVELYPVDIVAVRHEYFTERRAGKRFDDFLNERMNGRTPITARLDRHGQADVVVSHGPWWVHAVLAGEEDLEWRLPINVTEPKQRIELTPQNAYARTKSF